MLLFNSNQRTPILQVEVKAFVCVFVFAGVVNFFSDAVTKKTITTNSRQKNEIENLLREVDELMRNLERANKDKQALRFEVRPDGKRTYSHTLPARYIYIYIYIYIYPLLWSARLRWCRSI